MTDTKASTLLAHAGADPAAYHGAVNVQPSRMSTVVFTNYADYLANAQYGVRGYGRVGTPATIAFEQAVAALEGAHGAVATCSGLSAVVTALLAFTQAGDHVLMPDNGYGPGRTACEKMFRRYGVDVSYYPPLEDIAPLITEKTKLVFVEAPGSMTFEVPDIGALIAAAKARGCRVVCDNSWSSGLHLKPLALGADVSLVSATKYIAGHSDAMLGVLSCTEQVYAAVRAAAVTAGVCPGSEEVYLGLRGLRTLPVRMAQHGATGLALARWLATHPAVKRVLHPALESCPGHANWKKYFTGASGTFSIILHETRREKFHALLDSMQLFSLGFSWGGFESLLLPDQPTRTAQPWTEEGLLLRIHAGLEDVEDLKADLAAGFARMG
jgi:cysteine-S-conjugate beta-lyase